MLPGNQSRWPDFRAAGRLLADYLEAAGHGDDEGGALFRPLHHSRGDSLGGITPDRCISWCGTIPPHWALRLGRIVCAPRRRPTLSNTAWIWRKSCRCSAMPTSPRPACTISATAAPNRVQCSKYGIRRRCGCFALVHENHITHGNQPHTEQDHSRRQRDWRKKRNHMHAADAIIVKC